MLNDFNHFPLPGGTLSLDFSNTVAWNATPAPVNLIQSYTELVYRRRRAGAVSAKEAARLIRAGAKRTAEAQAALEKAWRLQATCHAIFLEISQRHAPQAQDVEALNGFLAQAMLHLRIAPSANSFAWVWDPTTETLDVMLWPIVRAAAELLASDKLRRVKACAAGCGWLFLDTSKSGQRRWCMMSVCGNRTKARRHYLRTRKTQEKSQA